MNLNETACCALGQICGINNGTTKEEILGLLNDLFIEGQEQWTPVEHGGQTATFAITTPSEGELAKNLSELGFKNVFEFPRRNGYPEGMLKLWVRQVQPIAMEQSKGISVTSLYACGPATVEVGKYGMCLDVALDSFLATCTSLGLTAKVKRTEKKAAVSFERTKDWGPFRRDLTELLSTVARVADLHGDAPDEYILTSGASVPENKYITTGVYND